MANSTCERYYKKQIRELEKEDETDNKQPTSMTTVRTLTAHALKGEKKCLAADMNDYLAKPLDEMELHQKMLKWVTSQVDEQDSSNLL